MNSPEATKESRLHIRASSAQKTLLARAAKTRHLNISQFVLQIALAEAEKVVKEKEQEQDDENTIRVSAESYDWLMQKLEEPPQEIPELRRLLEEKTSWNG